MAPLPPNWLCALLCAVIGCDPAGSDAASEVSVTVLAESTVVFHDRAGKPVFHYILRGDGQRTVAFALPDGGAITVASHDPQTDRFTLVTALGVQPGDRVDFRPDPPPEVLIETLFLELPGEFSPALTYTVNTGCGGERSVPPSFTSVRVTADCESSDGRFHAIALARDDGVVAYAYEGDIATNLPVEGGTVVFDDWRTDVATVAVDIAGDVGNALRRSVVISLDTDVTPLPIETIASLPSPVHLPAGVTDTVTTLATLEFETPDGQLGQTSTLSTTTELGKPLLIDSAAMFPPLDNLTTTATGFTHTFDERWDGADYIDLEVHFTAARWRILAPSELAGSIELPDLPEHLSWPRDEATGAQIGVYDMDGDGSYESVRTHPLRDHRPFRRTLQAWRTTER